MKGSISPVFLLVGAPAVGKSTAAKALAKQFSKGIHISVDALRDMVVSGIALPGGEWGDDLIEQLTAARVSAAYMAETYSNAGFAVVIDDFWDPNSRLNEYDVLFRRLHVHKILLFPNQQTAEARNIQRAGSAEAGRYINEGIRMVYQSLKEQIPTLKDEGWLVVDTSGQTVEETIRYIIEQAG